MRGDTGCWSRLIAGQAVQGHPLPPPGGVVLPPLPGGIPVPPLPAPGQLPAVLPLGVPVPGGPSEDVGIDVDINMPDANAPPQATIGATQVWKAVGFLIVIVAEDATLCARVPPYLHHAVAFSVWVTCHVRQAVGSREVGTSLVSQFAARRICSKNEAQGLYRVFSKRRNEWPCFWCSARPSPHPPGERGKHVSRAEVCVSVSGAHVVPMWGVLVISRRLFSGCGGMVVLMT